MNQPVEGEFFQEGVRTQPGNRVAGWLPSVKEGLKKYVVTRVSASDMQHYYVEACKQYGNKEKEPGLSQAFDSFTEG
jgi:hypothetical protein